MLSRLYKLDHLYGLLLTFGLALIIQGLFRNEYGSSGQPYQMPAELTGAQNLGFMFLPNYRGWIIVASLVVCLAHLVRHRAHQARLLPARRDREPARSCRRSASTCRLMITLTYGFGVALAAFAGVMAAPIYQVSPQMGADLIIVVFAVVVIGGMGSILGCHRHRLRPRPHRRPDQGVLSRGLQHRDLRHHGHRAADQAGRAVRSAEVSIRPRPSAAATCAPSASPSRSWSRSLLLRAPGRLSGVHDEGDVLRALRLRLQPAHRLRRPAVVRARHVPRLGRLRVGARGQGLGLHARARDPVRHGRARSRSASSPACWRSAARASTSR